MLTVKNIQCHDVMNFEVFIFEIVFLKNMYEGKCRKGAENRIAQFCEGNSVVCGVSTSILFEPL